MSLEKPNLEFELNLDSSSSCEVSLSDFETMNDFQVKSIKDTSSNTRVGEGDLFESDDEVNSSIANDRGYYDDSKKKPSEEKVQELNAFAEIIQKYIPVIEKCGLNSEKGSKLMKKLMEFSPIDRHTLALMLSGTKEDDGSINIMRPIAK